MAYARADWAVLRGALGVFVICLLLSAVMLGASHFFAENMETEYRAHHGRFRDASRKYLSVDQDERTIALHYPAFVELGRRGVIGDEHRLNWVEVLRAATTELGLPTLEFRIEPQALYSPGYPLATGTFDLRVSRMHLSLGLVHEGDMRRLFAWLDQRAEGLYSVRECSARRVEDAANPDVGITTECTLEWYTLELRGGRIEP